MVMLGIPHSLVGAMRMAAPQVGGVLTAMLLTLLVIPPIYVIWRRQKEKRELRCPFLPPSRFRARSCGWRAIASWQDYASPLQSPTWHSACSLDGVDLPANSQSWPLEHLGREQVGREAIR